MKVVCHLILLLLTPLITLGYFKDSLSPGEWFQLTFLNTPGLDLDEVEPRIILVSLPRWDGWSDVVTISLGSTAITLYRNRDLLHPHFVLLHRHENGTSIVTPPLTCTFRTSADAETQVAADICDGMHGVLWINKNFFRIQPLPKIYWTDEYNNIPHFVTHLRWNPNDSNPDYDEFQKSEFYDDLVEQKREWDYNDDLRNKSINIAPERFWANRRSSRIKRMAQEVKVETAVFVDRDLLRYMQTVFPTDTERHLLRFVLAMFNAVQLLYHEPSLGTRLHFVLKRLEILHSEPDGLQRPSDIDRYLSSFCNWQESQQPNDHGQLGWDHALMLTGLDLYVISKSGRISGQVVGLAPVAGMCLPRSSCTVNEGRHFESVFVVAHEIGHNLGMRHDGPSADNECDPSEYIMAPTLGSGKFTWSQCSRRYLQAFLQSPQAQCLFKSSGAELDHIEGGILPGQRFDSNMQCTLKHGPGSMHAALNDVEMCRDLRCTKERFTWTAHPALEGTVCSPGMWCRGGQCVPKDSILRPGGPIDGRWSEWGPFSECASACLQDSINNGVGSTGISVAARRCNNPRPGSGGRSCQGSDKKYQTCKADQCSNVAPSTITDFANTICRRAKEVEKDLTGYGRQKRTSNKEDACTVWCDTRNQGVKSKGWIFPDGTACGGGLQSTQQMFCIAGKCEEFYCSRSGSFIDTTERCSSSAIGRVQSKWMPVGPCHSNCIVPGRGLRVLKRGSELTIQLCHLEKACGRRRTVYDYANKVCGKFKERVKKLSGLGIQLSQIAEEPDRPCQVACQDLDMQSRFYLVTGEDGWFPYGTDCSKGLQNGKAYCVSGKCLEFGAEDTPVLESQFVFPHIKRKRSLEIVNRTVVARIDDEAVAKVIRTLHTGTSEHWDPSPTSFDVDWDNPVHVDEKVLPTNSAL